mmetsp:Transcript_29545/g.40795  ORF Transcript_29545/g.40795 Transcript_29545/m.40795 type:complete len:229 (+) Transcript_29545:375-1061(+)
MIIRSGHNNASSWFKYSLTRRAHCLYFRSSFFRTESEAYFSPSTPLGSIICPSSVFGTSLPSMKRAVPIPVPRVHMTVRPLRPRPAPKIISASPAASASFKTATREHPDAAENRSIALAPIHSLSMFAAVRTVPHGRTAAGNPTPRGPVQSKCFAISPTVLLTPTGSPPEGVGIRYRSVKSWPVSRDTRAPLIPVPPTSIPRATLPLFASFWKPLNEGIFVAVARAAC